MMACKALLPTLITLSRAIIHQRSIAGLIGICLHHKHYNYERLILFYDEFLSISQARNINQALPH